MAIAPRRCRVWERIIVRREEPSGVPRARGWGKVERAAGAMLEMAGVVSYPRAMELRWRMTFYSARGVILIPEAAVLFIVNVYLCNQDRCSSGGAALSR
jgi:hypothetical protein